MAVVQNEDLDGSPFSTAVISSWMFIWMETVSRDIDYKAIRESHLGSDCGGEARIPIVPRPPEVKYVRGL